VVIDKDPRFACTVVAVSGGYPNEYEKGYEIEGLEDLVSPHSILFHAGSTIREGKVVTNGGRVFCVTSFGISVQEAVERSLSELEKLSFMGMSYRRDIGYEFLNIEY